MVDFLMDNQHQRADASQTDSHGNTVLHALVIVADNSPENTEFITSMYDLVLVTAARLQPALRLEDVANKKGLTPFKMAAKMGKIQVSTTATPQAWNEQRRPELDGPVCSVQRHLLVRKVHSAKQECWMMYCKVQVNVPPILKPQGKE